MISGAAWAECKLQAATPSSSMRKRCPTMVGVLLLLLLGMPMTARAGCIAHTAGELYLNMPASGYLFGSYTPYSDSSCANEIETDTYHGFSDGIVQAASSDRALSLCEAHGPEEEYTASRWVYDASNIWFCGPVQNSSGAGADGTRVSRRLIEVVVGRDADGSISTAIFTSRDNLPLSGLKRRAFDGMNSGIQFRRLNNCGVGDPAIFEMGFLDAVDVWSNVGSGYSVCFPQPGRIVFLDAATSPRTLTEVENVIDEGQPCAAMDRAGTMVLVKGDGDSREQAPSAARRPGTDDSIDDAIELENCVVTPRVNLRLRGAPWGKILDVIQRDTELPAIARTRSWFMVTFEDTEGWSAAWLASATGDCDWSSPS